jgi:hypothetical protein
MIKTSIDRDQWMAKAQQGELAYHISPNWRQDQALFESKNVVFFRQFGFSPDDYCARTICDYGAGSKLRAHFFKDAHIIAIEPLANEFVSNIPWCDLKTAHELYAKPAEEQLPELLDKVDFLFSINVLDHCYNFERAVDNATSYVKQGGRVFLVFDCHEIPDELHPIVVNESICVDMFYRKGLVIEKMIRIEPFHSEIAKYALAFDIKK